MCWYPFVEGGIFGFQAFRGFLACYVAVTINRDINFNIFSNDGLYITVAIVGHLVFIYITARPFKSTFCLYSAVHIRARIAIIGI
ncbi:hypothetical protein A11A3_16627 [Alcanivorax hongdengensis A-11-3]|uniref:Uncharacterized protein n=1 Tax=Alcanivorax hongdengensis A-11-3 TaxID=1177179 RepID=L0WAU1_9GAMM|nr:hypothetical protein A11A3_16627 [Alcanivorax hongdengensis A-11-3]